MTNNTEFFRKLCLSQQTELQQVLAEGAVVEAAIGIANYWEGARSLDCGSCQPRGIF